MGKATRRLTGQEQKKKRALLIRLSTQLDRGGGERVEQGGGGRRGSGKYNDFSSQRERTCGNMS